MSTTITGPVIKDYTITADKFTFSFGGSGANVFRNKLINGDFTFNQRYENTQATAFTAATYIHDCWSFNNKGTTGSVSVSSSNDIPSSVSPTSKSCKFTMLAASVPVAGQNLGMVQNLEGQNLIDLKYGTVDAVQTTLSFWVKSNLPGPYGARIRIIPGGAASDQSYGSLFTVNASNVWEYKTITIPGNTTASISAHNAIGASVRFVFSENSNSMIPTASLNQWVVGNISSIQGVTNLAASVGNYIQITNVQFEKGNVATDFEYLPYDIKLRRCQRYFTKSYRQGVVPGTAGIPGADLGNPNFLCNYIAPNSVFPCAIQFPVQMRTKPTITYYAPSTGAVGQIQKTDQTTTLTVATNTEWDENGVGLIVTSTAGAAGEGYQVQYTADASL